jgi:RimJ/RimL family protein N-acetyltransferase
MSEPMRLDRVYVKELSVEYAQDYLDMFSTTVQKILGVSSLWNEFDYVHNQIAKQKEGKTCLYGIFESTKNLLIGSIEIRSSEYRGQLYTWLHEDYWGKGLFQDAFTLVRYDYFKKNKEVTEFTARVDVSNKASLKALLKAGCTLLRTCKGAREDQHEIVCCRLE